MFIVFDGLEVSHSARSAMLRSKNMKLVSRVVRIENRDSSHCTPKGVRKLAALENYKHLTPPE